jgi:hypothetical protein
LPAQHTIDIKINRRAVAENFNFKFVPARRTAWRAGQ